MSLNLEYIHLKWKGYLEVMSGLYQVPLFVISNLVTHA